MSKEYSELRPSDFVEMYEAYADAVEAILKTDPRKGTECLAQLMHSRVLMDINMRLADIAESLAILTEDEGEDD